MTDIIDVGISASAIPFSHALEHMREEEDGGVTRGAGAGTAHTCWWRRGYGDGAAGGAGDDCVANKPFCVGGRE